MASVSTEKLPVVMPPPIEAGALPMNIKTRSSSRLASPICAKSAKPGKPAVRAATDWNHARSSRSPSGSSVKTPGCLNSPISNPAQPTAIRMTADHTASRVCRLQRAGRRRSLRALRRLSSSM